MMGGVVVSRMMILGGGLLYPAYSSYKAVKAAKLRNYVRWIMYWIVFALYTAVETFTDIFLYWFPFYYTAKVLFVLWLSMPYTKGSTIIYRKLIHPNFSRREQEIDMFLEHARDKGYQVVLDVGSRGLQVAANVVVNAAVKSQQVVTEKLKSYSTMDLTSLPDSMDVHSQGGKISRERLYTSPDLYEEQDILTGQQRRLVGQRLPRSSTYSMYNLQDAACDDDDDYISRTLPKNTKLNDLKVSETLNNEQFRRSTRKKSYED